MGRPTLILDVGGVLHGEGLQQLMGDLPDSQRVHDELMTGVMTEPDFWVWLDSTKGGNQPIEHWQQWILDAHHPYPAVARVPVWAKQAELRILSNHLGSWLRPFLQREGIDQYMERIVISSEVGTLKPRKDIFEMAGVGPGTLYVDDKQANLDVAAGLGSDTVLADREGQWTEQVDVWLAASMAVV